MNEAVKSLKELCGDQPALFVVDWSRASDNCKKCYNMRKLDGDDREFQIFNHIRNIYKSHKRKNGFVQNYEMPLQPNRNVENWIANPLQILTERICIPEQIWCMDLAMMLLYVFKKTAQTYLNIMFV